MQNLMRTIMHRWYIFAIALCELREILARTLAAQGALVEPLDPDGLEIFAPPHLQAALALPEWSRVGFGATLPEQAVRVSFEAEWDSV